MIRHTILNKSRPRTLLLVHGLFTSAGYWLPYLAQLKDFRLLLLDIDYRAIADLQRYMVQVEALVATLGGGRVEAVIGHSLGCLIASQLPLAQRGASYEICPVYCARRTRVSQFASDLAGKLGTPLAETALREQMRAVDGALASRALPPPQSGILYLPDADPYFAYQPGAPCATFAGDHFAIGAALTAICAHLDSTAGAPR